ncbi:hypothetical protein C8F04DRAFT_1246976 [Mycena alexandri]|uniref:Uncharacterized protein n=1 Tax=Mycena alexandri TaxID=1745969 RepID=A0AAD6TLZ1_9AGAR|nr:hypothetical protein C8F04DRAFT_1246976 [Mycena alexandri]
MPDLPPELEREIFELAARDNRLPAKHNEYRPLAKHNCEDRLLAKRNCEDRLALCLVARRVRHWVDLIFFKMVTVLDASEASRFLRLIQSNLKPPGFFAAVKILCLTYSRAASHACGILAACTQVEYLACWVDFGGHPDFPQLFSQLPLRRLSMEVTHFLRIPLTPSMWFSKLTHLELVAWHDYDAANLSILAHLPRLTHVALNLGFEGKREHAAVVCSSCPLLRVLILIVINPLASRALAQDPRIVLQDRLKDIVGDWEAPYFGLPDMWDRADTIVEEQRALTNTGNPG